MSSAANWPTEQIRQAIAPDLPGFRVEMLPQIDSTNSELMRRARSGQIEPLLLVTEKQTAGRGRLGREWFSGEGASAAASGRPKQGSTPSGGSAVREATNVEAASSLAFSLGLPLSPLDWSGLSLVAGLGIVQSLHPDLRLKWPNDIWWHERKLAGILTETTSVGACRYVVVGVGINLRRRDSEGLSTPPAWLEELLPGIDAASTLLRVAAPLLHSIKSFEKSGFAPFQAAFNARDALRDRDVALSDGTAGVARGVDPSGALRVQTAGGLMNISSAEVSVRPVITAPS